MADGQFVVAKSLYSCLINSSKIIGFKVRKELNSRAAGSSLNILFLTSSSVILETYVKLICDFYEDTSERPYKFPEDLIDLKTEVLFLPTFRRVEVHLEESDEIDLPEGLHSGMKDIRRRFDSLTRDMKNKALEIASNANKNIIVDTLLQKKIPNEFYTKLEDLERLELIIDRTDTMDQKGQLRDLIKNIKIHSREYDPLARILNRLLEGFEDLSKVDDNFKNFVATVNKYLTVNELFYEEKELEITSRKIIGYFIPAINRFTSFFISRFSFSRFIKSSSGKGIYQKTGYYLVLWKLMGFQED